MKKFAPIPLLLIMILAFFALPALENNLWSVAFVRGSQAGESKGGLPATPQNHPHASLLQARAAMAGHDIDLALQLVEPLVPTTDPVILQTYAEILFSLEHFTEALEIWHSLGMHNKIEHAARVINSLGLIDYEILAWEKAYDIEPKLFWSLLLNTKLGKANQLREAGQYPEAIALYQEILQQFPDSEVTLSHLALAYQQMGEPQLALDTLEKAMPIPSADFQFYLRVGGIYEKCGVFDHARTAYQRALQVIPEHPEALQALERVKDQ